MPKQLVVRRGDLYYADLDPVRGSEQGGVRPVLIIQNDVGNRYSPTVIVAAITTQLQKHRLPTHVRLPQTVGGLARTSVILCEQVRTIDKHRLRQLIGHLPETVLGPVDRALAVSLGILTKTIRS